MTEIKKLLRGHSAFYEEYFVSRPELYRKLVAEGQSPKVLVICCSDSRVDPSIILNAEPGELFVIRNVANIVPRFEEDKINCHGTTAAIEYAVKGLEVEDIVIIGHSHCGGIKTLVEDRENNHTFIDNWLYTLQEVKEKAAGAGLDFRECCDYCEKEAVLASLRNLEKFPFVRERVNAGRLRLHGWHFCLESGRIETIGTIPVPTEKSA